jgi:hypothetical protein
MIFFAAEKSLLQGLFWGESSPFFGSFWGGAQGQKRGATALFFATPNPRFQQVLPLLFACLLMI